MAEKISAGFFHAETEFDLEDIVKLCKQRVKEEKKAKKLVEDGNEDDPNAAPFEVQHSQHTYRLTHSTWDSTRKIFSGTMWLVRDKRHPRYMTDAGDTAINGDIGEPASFAYSPEKQLALVEYNHTGPRHSVVEAFLNIMGITDPILLYPQTKSGMIDRMKNAHLIRKLEFSIDGREGIDNVAEAGESVKHSIQSMKELEGCSIHVTISMGHHTGGLGQNVKNIAERLSNFGELVKTVKVGAKENPDSQTKLLDLMNAREKIEFDVSLLNKELNHDECRRKLIQALHSA
ncbi:MAG: DUF6731 family protein [Phycisphaeraceae bacterium JB051]